MGLWSALAAEKQIRLGGSSLSQKWFRYPLLLTLALFAPLGFYLAYRFTDWSVMYFVDPPSRSVLFSLAVTASYVAVFVVGFRTGTACVLSNHVGRARATIALMYLGLGLFMLATWNRLMAVGTSEEFMRGAAVPFQDAKALLVPNLIVGGLYGILITVCLAQAYLEGRKLPVHGTAVTAP